MIKKLILSITLFTAFLLPVSVFATTVTVSKDFGGDTSWKKSATSVTDWAGMFNADFTSPNFSSPAYCIDIDTYLDGSSYDVTFDTVSNYNEGGYSQGDAWKAAWLMNEFSSGSGLDHSDYTTLFNGSRDDSEAGLQLAIWKELYHNDFTVDTTTNTSDVLGYYTTYITAFNNLASSSNFIKENFKVAKLANETDADGNVYGQDLIIYDPVPEPATMLLFGIGLLGIGAIGRKRKA